MQQKLVIQQVKEDVDSLHITHGFRVTFVTHIITVERCFQMWRVLLINAAKEGRYDARSHSFVLGQAYVVSFDQISCPVSVLLQLLTPRFIPLA